MKSTMINSAVMAALLIQGAVFAQEDPLLQETEQVVHTDEINIDGFYKKKKKPSEADRIQKLRRQMEEQHEQMMRKRVEDMRLEEEKRIAKKIETALQGQMAAMNEVATSSSAINKTTKKAEPVIADDSKKNRVSFVIGSQNIVGDSKEWSTDTDIKVSIETKTSPKVAIGFSAGYMGLTIGDSDRVTYPYNNGFNNNPYGTYGSYNYGVLSSSYNSTIEYSEMNFSGYAKFYFTNASKVKPYFLAGAGVHLGNFSYADANFSNEVSELSHKYISGSAGVGAEMSFTEELGASLSLNYTNNFMELGDTNEYPDLAEQTLIEQAGNLDGAGSFTISAGVSYQF